MNIKAREQCWDLYSKGLHPSEVKLKALISREIRNENTTAHHMLYLEPLNIHVGPGQLTLKCDLVLLSYTSIYQRFADFHRQFWEKKKERQIQKDVQLVGNEVSRNIWHKEEWIGRA